MKEITMYEANDGTKFEEYEECFMYEQEQLAMKGFLGKVTMFDSLGQGTLVKEGVLPEDIVSTFEDSRYLRFESAEAVNSFAEFIKEQGFFLRTEEDVFIPEDVYKYNEMDEVWYNYTKKIEYKVEFEKELREWGK